MYTKENIIGLKIRSINTIAEYELTPPRNSGEDFSLVNCDEGTVYSGNGYTIEALERLVKQQVWIITNSEHIEPYQIF